MTNERGHIISPDQVAISDETVAAAPCELRHLLGARVVVAIGMTGNGQAFGPRGTCLAVTRDFLLLQTELLDKTQLTIPWSKILHVETKQQVGQ